MTMKLAVLLMFVLAFAFVQATVILNDADGQRKEPAEFNEDDIEAAGDKWEDAPELKELADPEMSKQSDAAPRIQKRGVCYRTRRHVCFGKPRRCGIYNLLCCYGYFRQCIRICVIKHRIKICHVACRIFHLNHCFVLSHAGK